MQVEKAQVLLLRDDMEHRHGLEAVAVALLFVCPVELVRSCTTEIFGLHRFAAQAVAHFQAAFGLDQFRRQAAVHHQVHIAALAIEHAHRTAVGAEIIADALQEAVAQRLQRLRALQEGGAVVEQRQFAVLVVPARTS